MYDSDDVILTREQGPRRELVLRIDLCDHVQVVRGAASFVSKAQSEQQSAKAHFPYAVPRKTPLRNTDAANATTASVRGERGDFREDGRTIASVDEQVDGRLIACSVEVPTPKHGVFAATAYQQTPWIHRSASNTHNP